MDIDKIAQIAFGMTDEEREKEMAELIDANPPSGPTAKISRDERIADEFDEEWEPDKELMEDLESLGA